MAAPKTIDNRLNEIARIRARLLVLDRERDECERSPMAEAEVADRIDAVVGALAARAAPDLIGQLLIAPPRAGSTAGPAALIERLAGIRDHQPPLPGAVLLAAVMPDQFRRWLSEVAETSAENYPPALSATERTERLRLLADERADLERDEASACWEIENLGGAGPWRGDMQPGLVLGLEE